MTFCERCGRPINSHTVLCTRCNAESTTHRHAPRDVRFAESKKQSRRGRTPKRDRETVPMRNWDIVDLRSPVEEWYKDADDVDRSDAGLIDDQPEDWMDTEHREGEDIFYHELYEG